MKPAIVDSCVEPATSASVKTIMIIAGSASEAIMHLAARADAAEAGADVHAGQRQKEARAAEQRDDGDQVGRPAEQQPGREGRHQRRGDPGRGEDQIGRDAEQPGGVLGQHDLLAQQAEQIAVGLDERRPPAAQQPRLDLAHEAGQQRRQRSTSSICAPWTSEIVRSAPYRQHQQEERPGRAKTRLR